MAQDATSCAEGAPSGDVKALFPPYVVLVELSDPRLSDPLFPEEAAHIARAVDKRKQEFALGRTCARRALADLGIARVPLVPNPDRSVPWPEQVWGSVTHADGYCAAVAARRDDVRGIGIDAERKDRLHEKLWKQIAGDAEIAWFNGAASEAEAIVRATLVFSAKEAFYKAQFCATSAWVGFHDVEVVCSPDGGFELTLLEAVGGMFARGTAFSGRYCLRPEHVITGLVIARS